MRIAYHHRTLGDGAEGVHIREIVRSLRTLGHWVRVLALIGDNTGPKDALSSSEVSSRVATTDNHSIFARFKRAVPRFAFELAEMAYNGPSFLGLTAALRHFDADLLYERYSCGHFAGALAAAATRTPMILEVNAPLALERQQHEDGLSFPRTLERLEQMAFHCAGRCLVVSTPLRDHLIQLGVNPKRVEVMPNGADPDRFDPRASGAELRRELGLGGDPVVGFVGVVRPWHGPELLVRAVARHCPSNTRLLIIGDGPAVDTLEQLAQELGLGTRLHVTGRVPHEAIPSHLAACDVAVSPRATFYASPMKIPEYMAAGRAVVAPNMPNITDLIAPGRTGLLFEPDDADDLGKKLRLLLENKKLRKRLGRAAREEVETRLNWRANARRIVEIAHELGADRRRTTRSIKPNKRSHCTVAL